MTTHKRALTCFLLTAILGLGLILSGCQKKAEAPKEAMGGAASETAPAGTAATTTEAAGTPAEATTGQAAPATGEASTTTGAEAPKSADGK